MRKIILIGIVVAFFSIAGMSMIYNISNDSGDSRNCSSAMDSNGNIHVVWQDNSDGKYAIYYRKIYDNSSFGNIIKISNGTGDSINPSIAVDGNIVHIMWQDNRNGVWQIYYRRLNVNGVLLTGEMQLTTNESYDPTISAYNGSVFMAWSENDGGDMHIHYTTLNISNTPPVANFSFTPELAGIGDIISFNSTSYDMEGNIVNYTWQFGDGSTAYGRNVSHAYSSWGNYTVNLTVTDAYGEFDTISRSIKIGGMIFVRPSFNSSLPGWGMDHFSSIQNAIDNASANDTIKVYPGFYRENIIINKPLKLIDDPENYTNAVIDANGSIGITIESSNVLVENCTIYNGSIGIYAHNDSFTLHNITINNCKIYNCTYEDGAGIKFYEVNESNITNCSIYNNSGYGVWLINSSNNSVENNSINNCSYEINLISSNNNYVCNNTIYAPVPYDMEYYGIYMEYVNHSRISWNKMIYNISQDESEFYGIYPTHSNHNSMDNNTIEMEGNAGDDAEAYGIYAEYSTWNVIENNSIFSYDDEGIYLYGGDNNTIRQNVITNNFTAHGIRAHTSPYNNIAGNKIYNVEYAIEIYHSGNSKIIGNTILNTTGYGIEITGRKGNVIDRNFIKNSTGIIIYGSDNNTISNNTIMGIKHGAFPATPPSGGAGIWVGGYAYNNTLFNNTICDADESGDIYGILLNYAYNTLVEHTNIYNLSSTGNTYGIFIRKSNNNRFNNTYICNINSTQAYAFYSDENSNNNTITNMNIGSSPTNISFFYGNGIALKEVKNPPANNNMVCMNKFLDISNVSNNSWINITFHYTDDDAYYVNESGIALYHYNVSTASWEFVSSADTANNRVNANLTSFSPYGLFASELNIHIKLYKPWNLIAMPVNKTWNASQLAANITGCKVVVRWDSVNQRYVDYIVGINAPNNKDFEIELGYGYFVGVDRETWFNITGETIPQQELTLQPKWNVIGWYGLTNTTASWLLNNITNATTIVNWNATAQRFGDGFFDGPSPDFNIGVGEGIFVYVSPPSSVHWRH